MSKLRDVIPIWIFLFLAWGPMFAAGAIGFVGWFWEDAAILRFAFSVARIGGVIWVYLLITAFIWRVYDYCTRKR